MKVKTMNQEMTQMNMLKNILKRERVLEKMLTILMILKYIK